MRQRGETITSRCWIFSFLENFVGFAKILRIQMWRVAKRYRSNNNIYVYIYTQKHVTHWTFDDVTLKTFIFFHSRLEREKTEQTNKSRHRLWQHTNPQRDERCDDNNKIDIFGNLRIVVYKYTASAYIYMKNILFFSIFVCNAEE